MDVAFLGPYAQSPVLAGAENVELADNHNDLRITPANIERYRTWLESVLASVATGAGGTPGAAEPANDQVIRSRSTASVDSSTLPATGGSDHALAWATAAALAALSVRRRQRQRATQRV